MLTGRGDVKIEHVHALFADEMSTVVSRPRQLDNQRPADIAVFSLSANIV